MEISFLRIRISCVRRAVIAFAIIALFNVRLAQLLLKWPHLKYLEEPSFFLRISIRVFTSVKASHSYISVDS